VIGAWHEVLDGLRLAGRAAPPQLAVTEVARHAQSAATGPEEGPRVTVAGVDELAVLVNRAAFADGAVDEADAHRAVAQAIRYVGELRSHGPWWRRLAWSLDPRPLGWPVRRSRLSWPVRRSRRR
jgi:hypothetical protein